MSNSNSVINADTHYQLVDKYQDYKPNSVLSPGKVFLLGVLSIPLLFIAFCSLTTEVYFQRTNCKVLFQINGLVLEASTGCGLVIDED